MQIAAYVRASTADQNEQPNAVRFSQEQWWRQDGENQVGLIRGRHPAPSQLPSEVGADREQ